MLREVVGVTDEWEETPTTPTSRRMLASWGCLPEEEPQEHPIALEIPAERNVPGNGTTTGSTTGALDLCVEVEGASWEFGASVAKC